MSKLDALLHPVRLRIATVLLDGQQMTAQQIGQFLADEPPASLYRHLHKLVDAEIISVIATHKVRGVMEKIYALRDQAALLTDADVASLSREELLHYFTLFISGHIGALRQAVTTLPTISPTDVRFIQAAVYLDDAEFAEFLATRNAWLQHLEMLPPRAGRRRRLIGITAIPVIGAAPAAANPDQATS